MFGFIKFSSTKNHLKENRQVYLWASFIVFIGFIIGSLYSNYISYDNYKNYSGILKTYVTATENTVQLHKTSADIKNLAFIFFWSFFLFGKPFSCFFAFKSGFSIGFFISFFVKVYSFKGFFAGMAVLLIYIIFMAIPIVILTARSFNINSEITNAVFSSAKSDIKRMLPPYIIVFMFSLSITFLGNYINLLIIPRIINAIF